MSAEVTIFSIGFTQRTAEEFFGALRSAGVRRLLDVRLNNTSQLAGFAKRDDLRYFLREVCGADYEHEPLLAPTQEMLDAYKKRKGAWSEYEREFLALMRARRIEEKISKESFAVPSALLCSEFTAERCHRRLPHRMLAPEVAETWLTVSLSGVFPLTGGGAAHFRIVAGVNVH